MIWLEAWLQTPLAGAIGWTLFHSLWQGAIVAVVLAGVLAATRSGPRALHGCMPGDVRNPGSASASRCCALRPGMPSRAPARNPIVLPSNNGAVLADGRPSVDAPIGRPAAVAGSILDGWSRALLPPASGWLGLDAASAPERRLRRSGFLAGAVDCAGARSPALAAGCAARILPWREFLL